MRLLATLDLTAPAILDSVGQALRDGSVSVFDGSLRYLYASGPGLAAVGLTREQLVGHTLDELFPPAEVELVAPYYRRALAGESVTFDLPVFGRVYEIAASPLTRETIIVLVQDVTTRRTAEAEQEQQNRFVAVVAHELRQPLGPLRVAVDLIKRRPEECTRSIPIIERQLAQLERLVADLGDAAQLAVGHFDVRMEDVDLTAIADAAVRDATQEFGRTFVWAPTDAVVVKGDRDRLYQVITNLLSNAVRHTTPTEPVQVHVGRDAHRATVVVRDFGTGIDPDLLPRLFDPFVQGSGLRGRMGIGLHLVRAVVERHGGTIEAFSQGLGRGSRFAVMLPLRTEPLT